MAVMFAQKHIPFTGLPAKVISEKNRVRRFVGLSTQLHIGLFGSIIPFFCIAFFTRGDKICPGIHSSARPWRNVINRKIFFGAAILTFVVIAFKYILPGKINALVRGVHISIQAYYRWHRVTLCYRMQLVPVGRSYQFTFFEINKYERPFY